MPFIVKQEHFEGPLDLLLSLIEKRKLFVNDIALAKVTDDFISHIQSLGQFPMADSANFILIASTLLLIKSKSLLPTLDLTGEEERGIHDLEIRLKIYQEIKNASIGVKALFGKEIIFQPSQAHPIEPLFSPDASMTIAGLSASISALVNALPKKEFLPKAVVQKVMSLEEMITRLTERVTKNLRMSFKEFAKMGGTAGGAGNSTGNSEVKVHIIVSFLAMLELVKQGIIQVTQEESLANRHGDIHMETKTAGVPHYA
jgi:segregation and condensation protein A